MVSLRSLRLEGVLFKHRMVKNGALLQKIIAVPQSLTQKSLPRLGVEWFTLQINGCMVA